MKQVEETLFHHQHSIWAANIPFIAFELVEKQLDAQNSTSTASSSILPRHHFHQFMAGIGADARYHMVMENINCGTLFDHREQIQPADIPFMVYQVATAIKQLHAFQLTHGDLKDDNVGIRENGHIVMLDFGCSRYVGYPTQLPITPLCAPEVDNREDAGLPSDWYSVGMMMLQLYHKSKAARHHFVSSLMFNSTQD